MTPPIMKKILLALSLAVASCFNVSAQLTQDAVMAMCPDLPTVAYMIECADRPGGVKPYYQDFHEALNKAMERNEEMKAKTNPMRQAEKAYSKRKIDGTDVTVGQLGNMSDAELEAMANKAVKGRLGNLGVSMADLEALQSGKMTEKELADRMMAKTTGGLTVSDVQFIDGNGMSPEEIAQFMQMAGIDESVQAAAAKGQKNAAAMAKVAPLREKIARLTRRIDELAQKPGRLRREAQAAGRDIYNRSYRQSIESLEREIEDLMKKFDEIDQDNPANKELKIKQDQLKIYVKEYNSKYLPLWRNAVIAGMDVYKSELPPVYKEMRDTYAELYKLTGDPQYDALSKLPEDIAGGYLDQANYIDRYDEDPENL